MRIVFGSSSHRSRACNLAEAEIKFSVVSGLPLPSPTYPPQQVQAHADQVRPLAKLVVVRRVGRMRRNILLERHRQTVDVRLALEALHVEAALLGEKAQQLEGRRAGGVQQHWAEFKHDDVNGLTSPA